MVVIVKGGSRGAWTRVKAIKRFFYGREVFSAAQGVVVGGYELKVQKEVGCMAGFATVVICRGMI
jgi:hypothetical protein